MKEDRLSDTPNVFGISVKNVTENEKKELLDYLKKEGYTTSHFYFCGGIPVAPWYFVNIDNKLMAEGRIGIGFAPLYFKHGLNPKDFIEINEIYKSCKDLNDGRIIRILDKYKDET